MALRTPDDVFADFAGRRRGILRALTAEADQFFDACDPARENLCLYGYADGSWDASAPCEEVPPELPEPSIGINFARDGMTRSDWLSLVAVHSDSWLMAVAVYNAARLNANGRRQLFNDINSVPTCYEIVSSRAAADSSGKRQRADGGEGSAEEEEDTTQCANCGRLYQDGDFWIACDECSRWFDGMCVGMTAQAAEAQRHWRCPLCERSKASG